MKLNKTDYVLERASDGGYYAWLTVNMQCNAYGESPEEAVLNLQETMNEMICLLYTSPSPRDTERSRMPSSA